MEKQPGITETRKGEEHDSETAATNDNVKFKELFDIEDFRKDDHEIKYYTGLPDAFDTGLFASRNSLQTTNEKEKKVEFNLSLKLLSHERMNI